MSRIEVSKVHPSIALGPASDAISVPKIVAYVVLIPGDGGEEASNRQGHVSTQIVRKRT